MFIYDNINGTRRVIIRFDKFISTIKRRIEINKDRVIKSDIGTSPPLVFIKHLLQYIAEDRYLTNDIFDVYTYDILADAAMVSRKFDSTESGTKIVSNLFIKHSTNEFLIPTSGIIGTEVSILDGWDKWKNIRPIRMVANSSREIDVMSYETQLTYKLDKPKYTVICIDTSALLLKYIIYLRHHELPLDNFAIDNFIIEHILVHLYDDMLDVWISNILLDVMEGKELEYEKVSNLINASEIDNGILDIKELVKKYKLGSLKLGDIVHTYFYGDRSILDMINLYRDRYSTYVSNRYIGPELIKMSSVLSILMSLLYMTKDRQQETKSIRNIIIELDILSRKNWRAQMRSKKMIEDVNTLLYRVERLRPVVI